MSEKKSAEEIIYELIEFDDTPDDFYLKADIIKAMHEYAAQEVAKNIKLPSEEWVSQITTPFRSGAELYRDEIKRLNQID